MALQRGLGVVPGEIWTSKGGNGPAVRILDIDPDTAEVHYAYEPTSLTHPEGKCDLSIFVDSFKIAARLPGHARRSS